MIKMVMHDRVKYGIKSHRERARQQRDRDRGRERQSVAEGVVARPINLIVRENIYDRCGRIIRDN